MKREDLYTFLSKNRYGVVSSIGPEGSSQSALVGIAITPALEIIFDTSRNSRKFRNLSIKHDCSFVIGWSDEKTLQLEGHASLPSGTSLDELQKLYVSVWPDGKARAALIDTALFLVRPTWIRFSDYSMSPPQIDEFTFDLNESEGT
jgi:Pyridoxamine 5'-phosphate oxidase